MPRTWKRIHFYLVILFYYKAITKSRPSCQNFADVSTLLFENTKISRVSVR